MIFAPPKRMKLSCQPSLNLCLIQSSVVVHEHLNKQHVFLSMCVCRVCVCVCCCAFKNTCGLWVKENLGVATQQICIGEKKGH